MIWKRFLYYWSFVRGTELSHVHSPHTKRMWMLKVNLTSTETASNLNPLRTTDAYIHTSLNYPISGSGNCLSPVRHKAITWTDVDIVSFRPLGIYFNVISIKNQIFSLTKRHFISSGRSWPFCLGLKVLTGCFNGRHDIKGTYLNRYTCMI